MTDDTKAAAGNLAIGIENKRVVIKLPPGKDWIALDPDVSARIAEELIYCTMGCGVKVVIPQEKKVLTPMQRTAIERRVALVITNLIERKAKPAYMAKQIIDVVARELEDTL
jgi:hypothetical protein